MTILTPKYFAMGSFAEGLQTFFTKGALTKRCRISERKKAVIIEMIDVTSAKTCDMEEYEFELFMNARRWLNYQIGISKENVNLDVRLASFIHYWMNNFKYYPFSTEEFNDSCEWIMNKLSNKYSLAEMAIGENNICLINNYSLFKKATKL